MKKFIKLLGFIAIIAIFGLSVFSCATFYKDITYPTNLKANKQEEVPFSTLLSRAEAGDAEAQVAVGLVYRNGRKDIPVDYFKAYEWFAKAEKQGNSEAMYQIGNMHSNRQIGPLAYKLYDRRMMVFVVELPPINYSKAIEWYQKASNLNHTGAQNEIGNIYAMKRQNGREVKPNYPEAIKYYQKAANNGNGYAMANLMYAYYSGEGVKKDLDEARKWYEKALALEDIEIIYHLGCVFNGINGYEAIKLFRMAADLDHAGAQFNLGNAYANGNVVKKDKNVATKWFRLAAENGNAYLNYEIAMIFEYGFIVNKDQNEALKLFCIAAENGDARIQKPIGDYFYRSGNYEEAFKLFNKVAKEGRSMLLMNENNCMLYFQAIQRIRDMYTKGQGVTRDVNEAEKWGFDLNVESYLFMEGMRNFFQPLFDECNARWRQINPQ